MVTVPMVWSTSLNDNEPIPGRAAGRETGAAMESLAGSIGTGSSPGPVRWRFRAEPIRDSTDALLVQVYHSDLRVRAGCGASWI